MQLLDEHWMYATKWHVHLLRDSTKYH